MTKDEFDAAFIDERFGFPNPEYHKLSADFCSCGEGWLQLIHDLIKDLILLDWDKQIGQIKEKYGGLRFYINNGTEAVHDRIEKAEHDSLGTCEDCGTTEEVTTNSQGGWISSLCKTCRKD